MCRASASLHSSVHRSLVKKNPSSSLLTATRQGKKSIYKSQDEEGVELKVKLLAAVEDVTEPRRGASCAV